MNAKSPCGPKLTDVRLGPLSAVHPSLTSWLSLIANPITEALPVARFSIKLGISKLVTAWMRSTPLERIG